LLLAKGQVVFKPYIDVPEVQRFWWPRFQRMAEDFVRVDDEERANTLNSLTEISAGMAFDIVGQKHTLTARADRIDILKTGKLRIVDYKSGQPPSMKQVASGFAPQLTLEAALALNGDFKGLQATSVEDVLYIGVGGGKKGVTLHSLAKDYAVEDEARKALTRLKELLTAYQDQNMPYIPLHNSEKEDDVSDYDHLSRRLEWQMNGKSGDKPHG
jgi:ATP-dependent helicase/nuclease subunit B